MAGSVPTSSTYEDEPLPLSDINVTPLVDVTLVLLIVFMITVPAIVGTAPVRVDLPESSAIAPSAEPSPLVISVKRGASGELELYLNEQRTDAAGLRQWFAKAGLATPDQAVSLSADKGIPFGEVIGVIDLLESLGLKKVALETRHAEPR